MAWSYQAGSKHLTFGCGMSGLGLVSNPSVEAVMETQLFNNANGDGRRVGVDTISGQRVSLLVSARPDERPIDEVWRELAAAWRADEVRTRGGEVASITSDSGRTVFGRPRPISSDFKNKLFGLARAELVFECVDDLWYGQEATTEIAFVPPVSGGLTFPAEAPFTFDSGPSVRNGSVVVSGDVATWPVFEILGPVTNPEIDIVGVGKLVFNTTLAYDQTLTVDTRSWARWVKRDGAALPGALSPSGARLSDVSLPPGAYTILLRGYDPSGIARLRVRTWPAFTSF